MNPRFKIGEEIILQSKAYPEYNGEYVIEGISLAGECKYKGYPVSPNGNGYDLGFSIPSLTDQGLITIWDESTIKKKHFPSSESFDTMMSSLKQPQRV